MKRYSQTEIEMIVTLRKQGNSIPEIMKATGLPKTTIWHHVRDTILNETLLKKIRSNQGGSRERKIKDLEKASHDAQMILRDRNKVRDMSISVAMLYWAEGSKREFVFTNTDISMINMYLNFIQNILMIKDHDIHLLIRIADPIDPKDAISYWKKGTNISTTNIKINHNNVQNRTKTQYGICRVSVRKGGYSLKVIQGIIDAVKKELMPL